MKKLLFITSLLVQLTAFGGNEKGNGGGVFVCRGEEGEFISAELVDFYEATHKYEMNLFDKRGRTSNLAKAINKISKANPQLGKALSERLEVVIDKLQMVDKAKLTNTNDFDLEFSPKECKGS